MKLRVAYPEDLSVPAALVPVGDTAILMLNLTLLHNGRTTDEMQVICNTLLAGLDPVPSVIRLDELAPKRAERAVVTTDTRHTCAM